MNRKHILITTPCLLVAFIFLKSDMDGNKPKPQAVSIWGIDSLTKAYDFYFFNTYWDEPISITDTAITTYRGVGTPPANYFWAVDKATGKSTDTIEDFAYEEYSSLHVEGIKNGKIMHSATANQAPVKNEKESTMPVEADHPIKPTVLVTIGIAALLALVAFYRYLVKRKNRDDKAG